MSNSRQRTSALVLAVALAGLCTCVTWPRTALGQLTINPSDLNGRDFAGVRVPGAVQHGDTLIRAARAWTWTEGGVAGEPGPGGAPGSTQRLFLQGDVRVEVGEYRFTAANAVLWVQTVGTSNLAPDDPLRRVRQMAIVFDRVSDPGAEAGFSQAADRLLVTANFDGVVDLRSDSLTPGKPAPNGPQAAFMRESEERFARYLRGLVAPEEDPGPEVRARVMPPKGQAPIVPNRARPYEPDAGFGEAPFPADLPPQETIEPIFAKTGIVTFAVGTNSPTGATAPRFDATTQTPADQEYVRLMRAEQDNVLLLSGGVAVQYTDLRRNRSLQITAERAAIFLAPGPLAQLAQFDADQVSGVYLEGAVVATDGQYTLRGPRVYYDFASNRATMAEAVFNTTDPRTGLPIYVRAKSMKQLAANEFRAEGARMSASSFFTPSFAVGASSVTVRQAPSALETPSGQPAPRETYVQAHGITLQAGGVPFFWLPGYSGPVGEIPLSDLRVENSSGSGAAIKTGWNIFSLFGIEHDRRLQSDLLLDYYFERGIALGNLTSWDFEKLDGRLFAYALPSDEGRDTLSTGFKKEQDGDFRGLVLGENRWDLGDNWTLLAEVANQSDPAFVDAFFKDISREGRELTTAAYLRYQDERSEFSLLGKGTLNSYVPNQYLLQSQGYVVDKMPEAVYTRLADDLLRGVAPGLLTWSHEYRFSRMQFSFNEPTVNEFGFVTDPIAQAAFGVNANQSIADRLRAQGLNEDDVMRWDTRQELTATFNLNPFKVVPFAVLRFTGYDKNFDEINAFAPDPGDSSRTWYAAGVRASTEITRVDDSVENSFFDLHRIRHVITPSVTAWTAAATSRQENLPVYDDEVEALNTGSAVRAGVTQVWQTKRGGPGRWRNVDVFKLSTDFTFATSDVNTRSPIGRFFDARPEYSFLGNYFTGDAQWALTDVVSLGFNTVFDFDLNQQARTAAGGQIRHSPEFASYGQVRYINALDSTYVDFGFDYQLTRLYSLVSSFTFDTDDEDFQYVNATLRRRWPEAMLSLNVSFNNIIDETTVSVNFEPLNARVTQHSERVERLRGIGR